jgi:hypothetical protein
MIEHSSLLLTLAQIALGVLGFTGVVIALKHETKEWTPLESISFQALVTTTLTALVGSLLPDMLSIVIADVSWVWRAANLGIGVFHLSNFTAMLIMVKKLGVINNGESRFPIKEIFDLILGPILILAHFLAFFGFIPWADFLLVIGVVQQLYIGMGNFLRLVRSGW